MSTSRNRRRTLLKPAAVRERCKRARKADFTPPLIRAEGLNPVDPTGDTFVLLAGGYGIMSVNEARQIAAVQHRQLILERGGELPVVRLSSSGGSPAELVHG